MPPEADVADEPQTGVDTSEGTETGGGEAASSDPIAAKLAKFDSEFLAEYTGKESAEAPEGEGASSEADEVVESPAKAGAASDDEDERETSYSRLQSELAALREELRASRGEEKGGEALLQAAVSESPEIQQLESEMRAAENEARQATSRANEIIQEHSKLTNGIARLEGKLEVAADVDKLDIRDELREKRAELKDLEREYKEKVREATSGNTAQKKLAQHKADEVARLKSLLATRSTQAQEDKAVQLKARTSFDKAFTTGAKEYGLKGDAVGHMREVIKARVTLHLRTLQAQDPNAPAVDVEELVGKYWKEEAKHRGLGAKKAFTESSATRRETRTGASPRGTRLPASSSPLSRLPKDLINDANYWKARADKMVNG